MTALIAAVPFQRHGLGGDSFGRGMAWAAGAGLAEAIALMAIAAGGQSGHVAVTAAVSGLYPAIPLAYGLLSGREHLTLRQLLGIATVITGIALINIA